MKKELSEVTVKFRKSKNENSEVLTLYKFTPGEPFEFEFDTNGANIVVMEVANDWNRFELLKDFSLLNPYYTK